LGTARAEEPAAQGGRDDGRRAADGAHGRRDSITEAVDPIGIFEPAGFAGRPDGALGIAQAGDAIRTFPETWPVRDGFVRCPKRLFRA
jgi:hypothetical protein